MARRRHHAIPAARRTPIGKAAIACRRWCAGPGLCRLGPRSTRSFPPRTGRRRWSPRPASPNIKDKAAGGLRCRGQELQGSPRRLRPARPSSRKGPNKRREFFYWTDDGNLAGLRYEQWKAVFMEQKAQGFSVWRSRMVQLAPAVAVQPPIRSVRASPARSRRLRQVVHRACLCARPGAGARGATPHEFPAISAETKTGFILRRTGDGKAEESTI